VGDWNHDGVDSVGVVPGRSLVLAGRVLGAVAHRWRFGSPGDRPVVGGGGRESPGTGSGGAGRALVAAALAHGRSGPAQLLVRGCGRRRIGRGLGRRWVRHPGGSGAGQIRVGVLLGEEGGHCSRDPVGGFGRPAMLPGMGIGTAKVGTRLVLRAGTFRWTNSVSHLGRVGAPGLRLEFSVVRWQSIVRAIRFAGQKFVIHQGRVVVQHDRKPPLARTCHPVVGGLGGRPEHQTVRRGQCRTG